MDEEKFRAVFRDAHVIDLDFSQWDRRVRMVVIAREETASSGQRLPIYAVDFEGVRSFQATFHHHDYQTEYDGYHQWAVDDPDFRPVADGWIFEFLGQTGMPRTTIECSDITIAPIDHRAFDELNPDWDQPGQPLARPGAVEWWKKFGSRNLH